MPTDYIKNQNTNRNPQLLFSTTINTANVTDIFK